MRNPISLLALLVVFAGVAMMETSSESVFDELEVSLLQSEVASRQIEVTLLQTEVYRLEGRVALLKRENKAKEVLAATLLDEVETLWSRNFNQAVQLSRLGAEWGYIDRDTVTSEGEPFFVRTIVFSAPLCDPGR